MPTYNYQCDGCDMIYEVVHKMTESPEVLCPYCDTKVRKVILSVNVVIPPHHQAVGSKASYYGITDVRTGKGVEKLKPGWADSGPPGIRVKPQSNK